MQTEAPSPRSQPSLGVGKATLKQMLKATKMDGTAVMPAHSSTLKPYLSDQHKVARSEACDVKRIQNQNGTWEWISLTIRSMKSGST